MQKIMEFLQEHLLPVANKMNQNRFLKSISNGFGSILSIIFIGAIFTLLASLQIPAYQSFLTASHLNLFLNAVPTVTTNLMAVYTAFFMAYAYIKTGKYTGDAAMVGSFGLLAFFIMIPLETLKKVAVMPVTYLGSAGLFSAMILGFVAAMIYEWVRNRNWVIKMPDGVPPTIAKSFSALIPATLIVIVMAAIRTLFSFTSYGTVNQAIYTILQAPLTKLGASPITYIILILFCTVMWFFGIHGGMISMPFLTMLYTAPALENLKAVAAGQAGPNIITYPSWMVYVSLGGVGGTLGLVILMTFFAKSQRYKELGKLAILPGLFGINEPITFGFPIILNVMILIPFIVTPLVTFGISYAATVVGLVPTLNGTMLQLGVPAIFSGWLTGGVRVALLQIILIALQVIIYYPFFKALDNTAFKAETTAEVTDTATDSATK